MGVGVLLVYLVHFVKRVAVFWLESVCEVCMNCFNAYHKSKGQQDKYWYLDKSFYVIFKLLLFFNKSVFPNNVGGFGSSLEVRHLVENCVLWDLQILFLHLFVPLGVGDCLVCGEFRFKGNKCADWDLEAFQLFSLSNLSFYFLFNLFSSLPVHGEDLLSPLGQQLNDFRVLVGELNVSDFDLVLFDVRVKNLGSLFVQLFPLVKVLEFIALVLINLLLSYGPLYFIWLVLQLHFLNLANPV